MPLGREKPVRVWATLAIILGALGLTVYLLILVFGRYGHAIPGWPLFGPNSPWTLLALFGFLAGAALCASRALRFRMKLRRIWIIAIMALLSLIMGLVGYWSYSHEESVFWTELSWAAGLFGGGVENGS